MKNLVALALVVSASVLSTICIAQQGDEAKRQEAKTLLACFRVGEFYLLTVEQLRAGAKKEQLLAEVEEAFAKAGADVANEYKQAVEETYNEQPKGEGRYAGQKIVRCLTSRGTSVDTRFTTVCYDLTLHAKNFFWAKRRGIVLEQTKAEIQKLPARYPNMNPEYLEKIRDVAEAVYKTQSEERQFRPLFFITCSVQSK